MIDLTKLTNQEKEQIYREVEMRYRMEDAEMHLRDYFELLDEPYDEANATCFLTKFGCNIDEACDPKSDKYMLSEMAEAFLSDYDCNVSENNQWEYLIADRMTGAH